MENWKQPGRAKIPMERPNVLEIQGRWVNNPNSYIPKESRAWAGHTSVFLHHWVIPVFEAQSGSHVLQLGSLVVRSGPSQHGTEMQTETKKKRPSSGIRAPSDGPKSCVGFGEGMWYSKKKNKAVEPERWAFEFQPPHPRPHGSLHHCSPAPSEAYMGAPAALAAGPWLGLWLPKPLTLLGGRDQLCSMRSEQK